ncbi:TonB-dependent receptor plug domain-containing protein [Mangrovimonas sp. CR14]|nr:TonB-dependent receptor plug domain-containing protein [Mangrovimonas sp. CR14]
MPIKRQTFGAFLCFLLFFIPSSFSQEIHGDKELHDILQEVQKQYQVQFNYANDVVSKIRLAPPPSNQSLDEVLAYLKNQTGLLFVKTDDYFISIRKLEGIMICGYLLDANTMEAIESATIKSEIDYAVSDENGFFQLMVKNQFGRIALRHLGYTSSVRFVKDMVKGDCLNYLLQPNLQALNEVVISNFMAQGVNKVSDGSFQINYTDFDILPGIVDADVLHSLQAFPGVQSVNETVSNINIRGGTHDQNLILWDGIKMYQSGHFFGLISMYNPQITEEVSLLKNAADASYTDGVSGTILMKTDRNITPVLEANFGLSLIDANAFLDVPVGKNSSVQIAGRKSISDFIKTPTYNEFFDRISQDTEIEESGLVTNSDKQFNFYDASLRWLWQVTEKDHLRFNFLNVNNALLFNENAVVNDQNESRESKLTQNSFAGGLLYTRNWSHSLRSEIEIYETDYKLKSTNANILDSQRFLQENSVSESSFKLKLNKSFKELFNVMSGYHFVETKVRNLDDVDNPTYKLLVAEVLRSHGAFLQGGYRSKNRMLNLAVGGRYEYLEKFKSYYLEPRLNVSYQIVNGLTLEILGEMKHQSTSQIVNFQNDFLGIEKRRWQLANNEDIPIMESQQGSIGLTFERHKWLISIEGYSKKVEGITAQSQGFQNQYEYISSSGDYEVLGVDVLLRKAFEKINLWTSYSYMDNVYHFDSLESGSFPSNYDITHAVTLGCTYSNKGFMLSAGANWHTGRPISQPLSESSISDGQVVFGETNANRLDDYLRIDLSGSYDFHLHRKARAKIGFSIWNLLNHNNELNRFYQVNDNQINEVVQQALGFTPNVFLRAYF